MARQVAACGSRSLEARAALAQWTRRPAPAYLVRDIEGRPLFYEGTVEEVTSGDRDEG